MGKKFYTIMIVPHAAAKFRRLKVSKNFAVLAGCFLGLLVTAGLMFPHFLLKSSQLRTALDKLNLENSELKKANEKFDSSLADLRAKLSEFETKANKFALMVGVEDLNGQQMAAGGSSFDLKGLSPKASQSIIEGEINTLKERSGALQDSFRVLDMAFQKQSLLLSSTPSIFPVRGLMGNGFGWRRDPFTGMRDFHQGLDIVAALGTRVMAPADGIVTKVGESGGFGNCVFVSHGLWPPHGRRGPGRAARQARRRSRHRREHRTEHGTAPPLRGPGAPAQRRSGEIYPRGIQEFLKPASVRQP